MIQKMTRGDRVKWSALVAAPCLVALHPCNEIFTMDIKMFMVVVAFAIVACGTGVLDGMMAGILIPLGFKLFAIAPNSVIYEG